MSDQELSLMKSEITKVSSLTSESIEERWKIYVKVRSKSTKLRLDDGTQYFKVVLEDDSGQIDAFAFGSQNVHRFFDRFEEDKVYFISDGKLIKKTQNQPEREAEADQVRNINGNISSEGKKDIEKAEKGYEIQGHIQNENEGKEDKKEGKVDENEEKVDKKEGKVDENEGKVDESEGKVDENEGKVDESEGKVDESEGKVDDIEGKIESSKERKVDEIYGKGDENGGLLQNENGQKMEEDVAKVAKRDDTENGPKKADIVNLEENERDEMKKVVDEDEEVFYEIHLESGTVVTCQEEENRQISPFTPITELRYINKTFVDVVGIVTGVWKLEMKFTKYRCINITDENGYDVNVALWGKMATDFDEKSIRTVVSLKHVRVKIENGDVILQSTQNTKLDYKPVESEAVILREILGIAEDHSEVDTDSKYCVRCQKRKGSYNSSGSHSNKRRRYNSGNSSGRAKSNRNNMIDKAMCRRRRNKQVQGRVGRKIYIRKRNSTRDYFKSDDSDSDPSDSISDDVRVVRGRRRPVRHCQSLYSENRKRRREPTSSDDDSEDSDDDDFTSDDDTDASKLRNGKKKGKKGRPSNRNLKDKKKSLPDTTKKDDPSSSQGPATVISIQTDDESEVDSLNTKPVLGNKKGKKWKDSDSDATVSYLDGKNSDRKSGPVKKSGPVRRRKKQSSDEDFKGSNDDSSSDDSSTDDSDPSNGDDNDDDDDDDDKTDDGTNERENKKPGSKKTKDTSSRNKNEESETDDENNDDEDDEKRGDDKNKKTISLQKNLRKRGPVQKKKNNEDDKNGIDKGKNESIKPSGRKIKNRPRRNIRKKKNNLSDTDDLTDDYDDDDDNKSVEANDESKSTKKDSNTVGSTCKQRKSVQVHEDVSKAKSNAKDKPESTNKPRIRLILRKAKKKVSYSEADDKTVDAPTSTEKQKNEISKKGQEEKNETESPKPKTASCRTLNKQKRNVSKEVNVKDVELDALNSAHGDSRTRRSMRKRKSCDYDEGKDETINDEEDDGNDEKLKDSMAKVRSSRRSCRKRMNFTDDENEEKTDESDHNSKQNRRPKLRSSPVKRKSDIGKEECVENSQHASEHNDLIISVEKNMKTRSSGRNQKKSVSDLDATINDEDDLDDFDLIVETSSTNKNSEQKENVDVDDTAVDTANAKPKVRHHPGRRKNCVSDDEDKNDDISAKIGSIEESPQTRHSLRKRKSSAKYKDEYITNSSVVNNTEDRKHNTRRASSRNKTIVTDDDDDFQTEPEPIKKKTKPIHSARKRNKNVSDDENENKRGKDGNEMEKSDMTKNMPKLRVVIGKLQDDIASYSCGSKNGTDEEENCQSPLKDDNENNVETNDKIDDEVVNDNENDSDKRPSARGRSTVKRRQIGSDDEAEMDDKSETDNEMDEGDESQSHLKKKKFKRIKPTCTSSQETVQSEDPENDFGFELENSGNESETDNSQLENKDKQVLDEGALIDADYIRQLREFQKDDERTVKLLQHYILWFAMKAGGESLEDEEFQEAIELKNKLDARLDVVMNICQSQAWSTDFRADLMTYPEYHDDVKHSDLAGGDFRHLGNCQACNRENHPWSVIVKLEGEPYDRESYQMKIKEEGESSLDLPAVQYYVGCFCHPRTKLFHRLYHFGHMLYHKCKEMLTHYDNDEQKIDKVATDKSLFEEMYTKLRKLMKEAEDDYTEDGERGNNKWTREYNW